MQQPKPTLNIIYIAKHMQMLIDRGRAEGRNMDALEVTMAKWVNRYHITDEMLQDEHAKTN